MTQSIFKICVLGDGGVGKTTFVARYLTGVFNQQLKITIGVNFYVKKLEFRQHMVTLQIWDFAGEDRFRFILPSYLLGAAGAIFMYDITRFSSFRNFNNWMDVFEEGSKRNENSIPLLMVGSKKDLEYKRAVSFEDAMAITENYDIVYDYIECSAKTGENIELIFEKLIDSIMIKQGLI
jgi:small GTP-binding protein